MDKVKLFERICPYCLKKFETNVFTKKFCSKECRHISLNLRAKLRYKPLGIRGKYEGKSGPKLETKANLPYSFYVENGKWYWEATSRAGRVITEGPFLTMRQAKDSLEVFLK